MTDRKVDIALEIQKGSSVRDVNQVTDAITKLIGAFGALEATLNQTMTKTLPRNAKQMEEMIARLATEASVMKQARQVTGALASGGVATGIRRGITQGAVARITDDAAVRGLQILGAENKVLEARRQLYQRIRQEMPSDASQLQVLNAYRAALREFGDPNASRKSAGYEDFKARTLRETRTFGEAWKQAYLKDAITRDRIDAEFQNKQFDRRQRLLALHERQEAERENKRRDATAGGADRYMYADAKAMDAQRTREQRIRAIYERNEAIRENSQRDRDAGAAGRYMYADAKAMDAQRTREQRIRAIYERNEAIREDKNRDRDDYLRQKLIRDEADFMNRKFDQQQKLANRPSMAQTARQQAIMGQERIGAFGGAGILMTQARLMGGYALMGAGLGAGYKTVKDTLELQQALKKTQAIANATNGEMKELKGTIFDVGQTTNFTTKEIADAATVMAQAGYSASQINAALPDIAKLATGAGESLQEATNIVTSTLTVYDMAIDRSSKVSNGYAAALNQSKLSLQQLSLGVQYAGNIAKDGGVRFEELTAALGAMSNAGIKSGSTLGTGLRALIVELENPTKKFQAALKDAGLTAEDVDIKTQGLGGALKNLTDKGFNSAKAMDTFQIRAASAFSALTNNLDTFDQLQLAMADSNAAAEAAATQMDTLSSQAKRLGNSLVQLTTAAGAPFMIFLKDVVGALASLVSGLTLAAPVVAFLGTVLLTLTTIAVGKWIFGLLKGFQELRAIIVATKVETALLGTAFKLTPFGWIVTAISAAATAFYMFRARQAEANSKAEEFRQKANEAGAEAEKYRDRMKELDDTISSLTARHARLSGQDGITGTKEATEALSKEIQLSIAKFGSWGAQLDSNIGNLDELIRRLNKLRGEMAGVSAEQERLKKVALEDEIKELKKSVPDEAKADALASVARNMRSLPGNRALLQKLGLDEKLSSVASGNELSLRDANNLRGQLVGNLDKLPGSLRNTALDLIGRLNKLTPVLLKLADAERDKVSADAGEAAGTIAATPQADRVRAQIAAWSGAFNDRRYRASQETDPLKKNTALAAIRADEVSQFPSVQDFINDMVEELLPTIKKTNPDFAKAAGTEEQLRKRIYEILTAGDDYAQMALRSGDRSIVPNEKLLQQRLNENNAELTVAKQARQETAVQLLRAERADLQKRLYDLQNPDDSPERKEQAFAEIDQKNGLKAAKTVEELERETARIAATTLARKSKALEKTIATLQTSAGPDGGMPSWLVDAVTQQESHGVVGATGPMTEYGQAHGLMQVLDGTGAAMAKKLGVPWKPELMRGKTKEAAEYQRMIGTAYLQESWQESGGDIGRTLSRFHGGPDTRKWGPKTRKYVDEVMARKPANAAEISPDTTKLKAALDEWRTTSIEQIKQEARSQNLTPEELKARLDTFENETAPEYFAKVLGGNAEAVASWLQSRAEERSKNTTDRLISRLQRGGGDLEGSIDEMNSALVDALHAQIDAINKKYEAQAKDPAIDADAMRERAEAERKFIQESIQNTLSFIDAFYDRALLDQQRSAVSRDQLLNRRAAHIGALSNVYGNRNLSDVQRRLGQIDMDENINPARARNSVTDIQARLGIEEKRLGRYNEVAANNPSDPAALTALFNQENKVTQLRDDLEGARDALIESTEHMESFASATEAVGAAWKAFLYDANLGRPIFSDIADGMYDVFTSVRTGLQGMIKDVLTGTKTMGEAFKDFAMSVLDSMMDMAAKMIANQVLMWVIKFIAGSMGGGGSVGGPVTSNGVMDLSGWTPGVTGANGGLVGGQRFANGGIPNRDSVRALLMPGEVVMNRSAVEMVGQDKLLAMNAMGNRRLGEVKSVQPPAPREPDMVNVWVVAPDQQPQMGKNDILAIITDDIVRGGQTKKLVKAVAMGAV